MSSLVQCIHKGHNVWRETPIWGPVVVDNLGELLREGFQANAGGGTDQHMQSGIVSEHRGG